MASKQRSRPKSPPTPRAPPSHRPTTHTRPRGASPITLQEAAIASPPRLPTPQDPPLVTPLILVVHDEVTVGDDGIRALSACPDVYVHEGELVRLVPAQRSAFPLSLRPPTWRIEALPAPRLRELLSRYARWAVQQSDDVSDAKPTPVPTWVVRAIAARRQWPGIRVLAGLVMTPVLRHDGTVLETPGYDPTTGLYYAPDCAYPPLASTPTRADAQRAANLLLALVSALPFATDADRSAWLASVLTPLARFAIDGPTPLHLIDGTRSLAAPTELVAVTGSILCGRTMASVNASDLLSSRRRSVGEILAHGDPVALLTDVTGTGAPGWGRVLSALQRDRGATRLSWFVAGVELAKERDLRPSCLAVTLDLGDSSSRLRRERPVATYPRRDVGNERGSLVAAALTLLRAWWVAGCPQVPLEPWAGYESWSNIVRAALVWGGQADPLSTLAARESPEEATRTAVDDLIVGWAELTESFPGGCSVRQAFDALIAAPMSGHARLRAAIGFFSPGSLDDRSTADRLGRALSRYQSATTSGGLLLHLTSSGNQGNRWAVRRAQG